MERIFLIHKLPQQIEDQDPEYIRQGFLSEEIKEVSIRQNRMHYSLLVREKGPHHSVNYETPISKRSFFTLWPASSGSRIEKERRTLSRGSLVFRIDSYSGELKGLIIAKIKFPGVAEASSFAIPDYFGEELTWHKYFRNSKLSKLSAHQLRAFLPMNTPNGFTSIGVLPYIREENILKVMLITTRTNGNWIYPKGQPMPGKSEREVAQIEALEEAGIKGNITGHPLIAPYLRGSEKTSILLFPMEITEISKKWQEKKERKRKLLPVDEASSKITQPGLKSALKYLQLI
ncbi:MAG: NUDIX domain-containing protein [Spirochaetales bacterium]|nr:NUDIX domain-containing protein [Spirochaetales bacterium]